MRRLLMDAWVALHFFRAIRSSSHARWVDRVADAGAMVLTRALRIKNPDAPLPYVISLDASHARDVVSPP